MQDKLTWKQVLDVIENFTHRQSLSACLDLLLTSDEKEMLIARLSILHALLHKTPQRDIATTYQVSIAQITRGSHVLKQLDHASQECLKTCLEALS